MSTWMEGSADEAKEYWRLNSCTIEWKPYKKRLLDDPEKLAGKNRYDDIIPFRHSRVHLVPRASIQGADEYVEGYINANFVDCPIGPFGNRKIIAC